MKELGMPGGSDIVTEAQLIIDRYASRIPVRRRKKRRKENRLWFFAGIVTSAAFFLAILLKIY